MTAIPQSQLNDLVPYQPGTPIELVARRHGLDPAHIIKLASNENPLGMSPKAKQAIQAALNGAHRYPEQYELLEALAAHHNLTPDHFILGNGSNDVLDLIARTYLGPGREAISSQYAFAIYQIATTSAGATNVVVPAKEYGHDLPAMLAAITPATSVIWIANPNNPTGTFIPYAEVKSFIKQVPKQVTIVLDEAYYEYLAPKEQATTPKWLKDYPNLILTRTFSKIYGLAGLRVGYGITTPPIAELLNRVRQPFNANNLALAAATAVLSDQAFVRRSYTANTKGRTQLIKGLAERGFAALPAYGNFVAFRAPNALALQQTLLKQGIIIRPLATYGMPDWLRVTVGTKAENKRFLEAISKPSSMAK